MTTTIENLVGQKFGRWTLIRFAGRWEGRPDQHWECECDCGTLRIVRLGGLKIGHSRSCGCWANELRRDKLTLPDGEASFNVLFKRYKAHAEKRGLLFNLNRGEFEKLTKQDCHYCGIKPGHVITGKSTPYVYNGIDRVDNSRGYNSDNVVSCCGPCNKMKWTTPVDEFLDRVHRIVARRDNY